MKSYESHSLEETAHAAREWLAALASRHAGTKGAVVAGLSGHLGAGKTAFTKAVALELGVTETVTSPTFVLMKIYETTVARWPRLIHIDAYRLERAEDLAALDWNTLIADPRNLIMIEWPENVGLSDFAEGAHLSFEIRNGAFCMDAR